MKDAGDISRELLERLPKPNILLLQLLKKTEENEELKRQLEEMTKDRDRWKQRAIDTYCDS